MGWGGFPSCWRRSACLRSDTGPAESVDSVKSGSSRGGRAVEFSSLGASETRRAGETLDSDPGWWMDGGGGGRWAIARRGNCGQLAILGHCFPSLWRKLRRPPPGLPWPPESQDGHAVHLGFPFSALNEIHPRCPTVQNQLLSLSPWAWDSNGSNTYRSYDDENPNKSSPMTRRNGSPISVKDLQVTRQLNRTLDFRPS